MQRDSHDESNIKSYRSKSDNNQEKSTRRSVIRTFGLSAASLSVLGAGTAAAQSTNAEESNSTHKEDEIQEGVPDVEPQAMNNATTKFSPYNISTSETSTLQSEWEFQTVPPIPANYYQIDILVNSDHVSQPDTVSYNINESDITKDWDYRSSSPVGSAYQWQAKLWVADLLGASVQVDAEINPTGSGEVEAKTGTFWPWQSWSTGNLDIS